MEGDEIVELGSFTLLLLVFLLRCSHMLVEAKVPQDPEPFAGHEVPVLDAGSRREERGVAFGPDLDIDLPHAPLEGALIEASDVVGDQ